MSSVAGGWNLRLPVGRCVLLLGFLFVCLLFDLVLAVLLGLRF